MTPAAYDPFAVHRIGGVGHAGSASAMTPSRAGALPFSQLLEQAKAGAMDSGRPVTLGQGVHADLTEDQMKRVAAALDRAEAAGAAVAVVLVDGAALTVDVLKREVTAAAQASPQQVLTGIDAVVLAAEPRNETTAASGAPERSMTLNGSLARLLGRATT
jgi:hypothetical protein